MRRQFLFSSVVFLVFSGAALGVGVVVGPARLELHLAPGDSETTTLSISNPENAARVYRLRVVPFTLTDTGDLSMEPDSKNPPAPRWIEINPEEIEIPALQSAAVRVRIAPPAGASGTVWAGVLVSIPPTSRAAGGFGIMTEPRVFVPIYLTIRGTERTTAEITSFQAVRDREGVFHFRASLHNTGNTLIRPAGSWLLEENTPSGPVELLVVPFSGEPVLPGQTRRFEGEGRGKVPSQNLLASVFLDFGQKRGDIVSWSGPVTSVDVAPKAEARGMVSGVVTRPSGQSRPGSAARPFRISLVKNGIRLDSGATIPCRSELRDSPPALILELVGYRLVGPRLYRGAHLVESLRVDEVQAKPAITRLEVRFRVPVDAKVLDQPTGVLVALSPKGQAAAASPPVPAPPTLPAVGVPPAVVTPQPASPGTVTPLTTSPAVAPSPKATMSEATKTATPRMLSAAAASPRANTPETPPPRTATPRTLPAVAAASKTGMPEPTPARTNTPRTLEASVPRSAAQGAERFAVQVGSFAEPANARALDSRLTGAGFAVMKESSQRKGRPIETLLVGPYTDRESAEAARSKLRDLGLSDSFLRRLSREARKL